MTKTKARFETKDSGKRAEYATGAKRDTNDGKGRYDLLPVIALRRIAQLYQRGAEKYEARNWEKGIPDSRFADSCMRHLCQYIEGDREEDHAAAVVFNALGLIFNDEMVRRGLLPTTLLDLPNYMPKGNVRAQSRTAQRRPVVSVRPVLRRRKRR